MLSNPPVPEWIGISQVVDLSGFPPGDGEGFLQLLPGSAGSEVTHFQFRPLAPPAAGHHEHSASRHYPIEHPVPVPEGDYHFTFHAHGNYQVPPPLTVNVRRGIGTYVIVYYFTPEELANSVPTEPADYEQTGGEPPGDDPGPEQSPQSSES